MPEFPPLCIILLTYNRLEYALKTLYSTLDYVRYSGRLSVHIADDGSPEGYRERLAAAAASYARVAEVGMTNGARGGYGHNYNLATQAVHESAQLVLPLEDDWQLTRPLDLDRLALALLDPWRRIGCIRLGYLGYTQPLFGEFVVAGGDHYVLLNPASPEPHVFAGHPRLETVEWERTVGPWAEGLNPGATEVEVCRRPAARRGVAWPADLAHPWGDLFAHIGSEPSARDHRELGE